MLIRKLELSIPVRLKSHEVTVVPMFAPMMIPIACDSFMMPEFTKPTTMTVVAEDDWITAVTPAPSNTDLNGFEVRLSKIRSNFPPDIFSMTATHNTHSVQEHCQTADHCQNSKNIHNLSLT